MKNENDFIRLTAAMEGRAVTVRTIGRKVKVSQMELICLCNFAKLGLLSVFAELDGDDGATAAGEIDLLTEAIRQRFAKTDSPDGLTNLANGCVAILSEERLARYIVPTGNEEHEDDSIENNQ